MRIHFRLPAILAALLFSLGAIPSTTAQTQDAATMFGTYPMGGAASLSPSGHYMAFVATIDNVQNVIISDLTTPGKLARTAIPDARILGLYWHNDNYLLADIEVMQKFQFAVDWSIFRRLAVIDPTGKKRPLQLGTNGELGSFNVLDDIVDMALNDPNHIYVSARAPHTQVNIIGFNPSSVDLFRVDLDDGKTETVQRGLANTSTWYMDGSGHFLAQINTTRDAFNRGILRDTVVVPDGNGTRAIATLPISRDDGYIEGLTPDGKSLAILGRRGNKTVGLYPLDLSTGQWGEPLFNDPAHDALDLTWDERTLRVSSVRYFDNGPKFTMLTPEMQQLQRRIEETMPDRRVMIDSMTADRTKVLITTSAPQSPPVLQLVDFKANRIDTVADAYPQLRGVRLGEVSDYTYTASDGATLHGQLTLPPGKDPHGLPLVVIPPGTFFGAMTNFDFYAQYFAHQGYAVFLATQRDATHLGDSETIEDVRDWANRREQDMTNAVADLVTKNVADAKRVCIVGGGGEVGYTAVYSALLEPDRYACAVNFFGLTDVREAIRPTTVNNVPKRPVNFFSTELTSKRDTYSVDDMVRLSPASRATEFRTPVLLIEGDEKEAMRIQVELLHDALVKAGKPVEFVTIPNENGLLTRSDNRITFLTAIDKFLGEHIGH